MATVTLTDLGPIINALTGVNFVTMMASLNNLAAEERSGLIQVSLLAAVGGTKPLRESAVRPNAFADTVFVKKQGYMNEWNTTALSVLGHVLIKQRTFEPVTAAFADKYGAESVWDMVAPNPMPESGSDVGIKLQIARERTFTEQQRMDIAAAVIDGIILNMNPQQNQIQGGLQRRGRQQQGAQVPVQQPVQLANP